MALLQISEPAQSQPQHRPHQYAAGIDLGTTHSLVATIDPNSTVPYVITDKQGNPLLPSVVQYLSNQQSHVGDFDRQSLLTDQQNTLTSVKRLLGKTATEIKQQYPELAPQIVEDDHQKVKINTEFGNIDPIQASAEILKELASRYEQHTQQPLSKVVITVPAYFDDAQRQATKAAAKIAGLNVMRLINEPTAAAIAYDIGEKNTVQPTQPTATSLSETSVSTTGLSESDTRIIVVYDFGGGTFDVSMLQFQKGIFQVLATAGDTNLGGDDIDRNIAMWVASQCQLDWQSLNSKLQRHLLLIARAAKERLSLQQTVEIEFEHHQLHLNQEQLHPLVTPFIDKTLTICRRVLQDAQLDISDIDHVILAGGSTQSPPLQAMIKAFFAQSPLTDIDTAQVVALGAAKQAHILAGNKSDTDILLLDVVPLSLGIELMGGITEKIITRNSTIPYKKAQKFTTHKNNQTGLSLHVVQGERELAEHCRSLAKFELTGIPPMVAGAAEIEVRFQVDTDGLLSVTAIESTTNKTAEIVIKPSFGLGEDEINDMIQASYKHAHEDIIARQLREQITITQQLIDHITQALELDGKTLLTPNEYTAISKNMHHLQTLLDNGGTNTAMLKAECKKLSEQTDKFATLRMDKSLKSALSNQDINQINFQEKE